MAATGIPHFCNDLGVPVIEVGAHEFMCIGATPPFDHPHIFLDMGNDTEIVCSYCSTLYRHNPALKAAEAKPEGCVWQERPVAA
ncbi:zinc-finger domain-containing protein [Aquabacter sp. CN5-332]|uniref:zinc-finger domain-containing protein n=1 Tax=Aquabacter sp. CN5-332 TaxID=3156608 RepID=UPI0032B6276E